jgi:hypothetical protein
MEDRIYVATPDIFSKMVINFLDNLKKQQLVNNYMHNPTEREFVIHLNPDADIQGDRENLISHGIFYNSKKILENLGYENIDTKVIQLPMHSVVVDDKNPNMIRLHY